MQQINLGNLNRYEIQVLNNLEVEHDGIIYKGFDLIDRMTEEIDQGNYTLYNLVCGGIGTMKPIGNLLSKLGIE